MSPLTENVRLEYLKKVQMRDWDYKDCKREATNYKIIEHIHNTFVKLVVEKNPSLIHSDWNDVLQMLDY